MLPQVSECIHRCSLHMVARITRLGASPALELCGSLSCRPKRVDARFHGLDCAKSRQLRRTMPPAPWKTLASRYLVRDRWMKLRADRCETANGIVLDPYYVQEVDDWAQVVAFDPADRILVIRQYRHGAGRVFTELPCGGIDRGEPPIEAASRELLEETGCTAESLQALPVMFPNPARYNNRIFTFMATGARHVQQQQLDATEDIEFEFLPLAEVLGLIDSGSFSQALHVSGLFLALRRRGMI